MAFAPIKKRVIGALRAGNYVHEARDAQAEKNLLAVGEVDVDFVIRLLNRTSGLQHAESPHHWAPDVTVHTFRPVVEGTKWYVKVYFLDENDDQATFISVHT